MSASNWRGKYRPSSSAQQEEAMNEMEYEGAFEEVSVKMVITRCHCATRRVEHPF